MDPSTSKLLESIERIPLSEALGKALRIAQALRVGQFEHWCRLELGGYVASNSAMPEDTVVPAYRTVTGQHADIYGRILLLPTELAFVGETRLRYGVEELEALARTRDTVLIHDPHMCQLIRAHLQVEVYSFSFSTVHVTGILSAIRMEISQKLSSLDVTKIQRESVEVLEQDEIIELHPNLYGIGINLRALWRRWRGTN